MSHLRSNKAQLAAVVVLAALLFTLAVFQYNWLGELSERNQERMSRTLDWATRAVRTSFDTELADLYTMFQVDFREEQPFPAQLAAHYTERVNTVEGPDILESIYWVNLDDESGLVIQEFTGTALRTLAEWPEELAHLEADFAGALRHNEAQFELPVGPLPLHEDIPALVIQQVLTRPSRTLTETRSISWVIATLRRDVILNELIPALSDQFISGEDSLDYNIGITRADDPSSLVYASDAALTPESFADPDVQHGIYALHWWDFNLRNVVQRRAWTVVEESAEPRWNLVVKHQAGSLEAAVAAARNRSLAMSLGVLLLLGASIAMIVASTRRAQRLAAQQMEFVAGVSHELRTPLAVIRAAGENLADDIVGDPDKTRQYGELINREGRRLSDMVERVLLFATIRSDSLQLQSLPVAIGEVIDDAIDSNRSLIAEQSVTVKKEVPENLPAVLGDAGALNSALQNLLSNALKYSRRGDTVGIQVRETASSQGRHEIQIAVRDEGDGIPSNEIPHLFEPFFRGQRARQAQIQGSGLGLSLVKQVIEAHGGSISVESVPDAGSTFLVRLPAATP